MSEDLSIFDKMLAVSGSKYIPIQASLELTNRCNERCTHCYIPSFKDDPSRVLSLESWKKIIKDLRKAGSFYLIFMGGEAMLSPYFWPLCEYANNLGFSLCMISNGLLIRESTAKRLSQVGMQNLNFSVYSLDPEIHDSMTKVKGSCKKVLNAVEWCHEQGLIVTVNCLLTKANIDGFFDLADWLSQREIGIKADMCVTPKLDGNMEPTKLRATPEQLQTYYRRLVKKWPSGLPKPSSDGPEDFVCNAAKGKCAVTAYGDLLPCIEIREPIGNLLKDPFEKLWRNHTANKWRNLKIKQLKNSNCGEGVGACEHCPGMADHESGDPLYVSEFFKELARIKHKVFLEGING